MNSLPVLEYRNRDCSPFKWPVGVITLAQLNVCLYACKAVNAVRNEWENMPGGQITVTMNQLQWFTWFSRLHRFLPLPFLSALVTTDGLTRSPGCITWPRKSLMYYLWWGSPLNTGAYVCGFFLCIQSGKRYFFFKLVPLPPPPDTPTFSITSKSNSKWMLNKPACWIIEDLRPEQALISIQAVRT